MTRLALIALLALATLIPPKPAAAQDALGGAIFGGAAGAILGGALGGGRGAAGCAGLGATPGAAGRDRAAITTTRTAAICRSPTVPTSSSTPAIAPRRPRLRRAMWVEATRR